MSWPIILGANAAILVLWFLGTWMYFRRRAHGAEGRVREERFEHQLLHDDVTKLPNRTLFRDRLERALARSVRRRQACAVLSIDIDRFKRINDGLGPAAGDALLRDVATRLDACLRPEDTVARTGSDEFMALLESVETADEAVAVSSRVTEALGPPFDLAGSQLFLTASIGIALGRGGRDRPEDVLQNADVAVHRAKDNGRARCEVFRQEMTPHPLQRLGLEADLRRAVERMDFELAYQPQVQLDSGRIAAVEALVRWRHPERGLLEPADFIPVAEETGLVVAIGRWVLQNACADAVDWVRASEEPLKLCVNLSARELQQPRARLADGVSSVLARTGLDAGSLCIEVAERALVDNVDPTVAAMRDLERLGVEIALDDFGSGYSSLSYLRRFPLARVKVDRSFVRELSPEGEAEPIVRALAEVSHALDAIVIGEGIESVEQLRALRALGCDLGQGNLLSAPVPAGEMSEMLAAGRSLLPATTGNG